MDGRTGRASWSPEMKKLFIDLCLEQVKLGGRPGSNLKTSAWKKVREEFNNKNLTNYDQRQFKNYWDMLRKQWNAWKKLISITGIGEVAPGQTVQMDQERWDEQIKANPEVKQFRYKPLPHADEMEQLFGGVTATGEHAFTPAAGDSLLDDDGNFASTSQNPFPTASPSSVPETPMPDPVPVESEDNLDEPISSMRRKRHCPSRSKRKSVSSEFVEKIDGVLDRIAASATSQASALSHGVHAHYVPPPPTSEECFASLQQMPEIDPDSELYVLALRFFLVDEQRRIWMLENRPSARIALLRSVFNK
ncbi:hypothetical protein QJS10_CPA03g00795 [Acorus calamus]|uniref:Myb/SANT-like domain-containing protein n=1 Tax=Acorus calamus TaxID=4465 RepID=A0AAV9DKC5_ACOCL|nr:hypothetical protein QJS10_CPB15g00016 [Acorus calamus]KAK1300465.1 hypothetical protein QJS10_CPB13g00967 [Acorus calamus]KAK1300547.1 hypothetical protein QJS10_CPB13g01004 [Acorus calamus]KAK1307739.1 hypothetical protein QJS10_CPA09g01620 [Acorus calamus]KAK1321157.1 hypothetical protein QJS10_CPA03g00795 [Acorus calamus]